MGARELTHSPAIGRYGAIGGRRSEPLPPIAIGGGSPGGDSEQCPPLPRSLAAIPISLPHDRSAGAESLPNSARSDASSFSISVRPSIAWDSPQPTEPRRKEPESRKEIPRHNQHSLQVRTAPHGFDAPVRLAPPSPAPSGIGPRSAFFTSRHIPPDDVWIRAIISPDIARFSTRNFA